MGGHVGFDSLPDQLVSKSVTQGFCFNILCVGKYLPFSSKPIFRVCVLGMDEGAKLQAVIVIVVLRSPLCFCLSLCLCPGETGIGKSTLMNTLFNTMFENEEASHYQNGVYLRPRTYDLQESNVHLKLTIVDTVGFGDQINKEDR